ncbi:fungal-specific transcription factor domain-containing protein [Chytridium lagenaria]|nr:fungal-specific transcription factor domain-containing protein [Chytridium lagenaria]
MDSQYNQYQPVRPALSAVAPAADLVMTPLTTILNHHSMSFTNPSDLNASEAAKPKRIPLACDGCKRRKYRCDGHRPSCSSCVKGKRSCHYTPRPATKTTAAPTKPKGPRALHAAYLRERIRQLEARAARLDIDVSNLFPGRVGYEDDDDDESDGDDAQPLHQHSSPSASDPRSSSSSTGPLVTKSRPKKPMGDKNSSSAHTRIHTILPPETRRFFTCRCEDCIKQAFISGVCKPHDLVIPKAALQELIELWFSCHYHVDPLPMFHRLTFIRSLSGPNPPSDLLLHAMYATAAHYSSHPSILQRVPSSPKSGELDSSDPYVAGEPFYGKARSLVMKYIETPSLSTVQALVLISHFSVVTGRMSAGWQYLSMAIDMAYSMDLHVDPETTHPHLSVVEKDVRRRTFWVCVVQDRMISTLVDRDVLVQEFPSIRLPLPEKVWESYWDLNATNMEAGVVVPSMSDPFCALILLVNLFSRIQDFTKESEALHGGLALVDSKKRAELNAALDEWFNGLSPVLARRPVKDMIEVFDTNLSIDTAPPYLVIFLHVVFNTCRLMLHRPLMMDAIKRCHSIAKHNVDFKICDMLTLETARILIEVILPSPKTLNYLPSFLPYFIFQSCLSHILIAQIPQH